MKKLLLLSLLAAGVMSAQAQVVINELMQSNIDCIMDDINEFPDSWVELYNAGDAAINLKDYKLGLTDNPAEAFALSNFTLDPKAYKLVYCDKYDDKRAYHAPFRLESGKDGSVYLFKGDEIVDKVEKMKKQPAPNVAYGRKTDGAEKWGYQLEPTPEKANTGKTCSKDDILKEPIFSVSGQVFETSGSIDLVLSLPEGSPEGTRIMYTTDGSEPDLPSNGHWETSQILVWENPDPAKNGTVGWSGKYRFAKEGNQSGEEIAIIPEDLWNCLREAEFQVILQGEKPQIRVTTGWWSTTWTDSDIFIGNDRLVDNGDGTKTLAVNLADDPILESIDREHLLLTGNGYTPLRIIATQSVWVEDAETRLAVRPSTSKEFTGEPLKITSSTVVRAKLFCDGYLSPRSSVESYIFHNREMNLPIISLVTNNDYFYGSGKLGIYTSQNNSDNKNDCRRPLNIEYFTAPGEDSKINQLGETRVAGGGSRNNTYKTLVLYANKRFHEQKRFSYEFFPEDRLGQTEFKSLMLRNSGNDFDYTYMRDAIMQRSFAWNVDLDYQAYSPTIVYINGKYLGILNMRERSNEDNIYTNYDKLEDIDMFENWNDLKTGTWDNKNAFEKFYTEQGHTMAEYEQWMDIDEYINYMFMQIFYSNRDFPGNNIVMWRPIAEGGRWRWIAKDTDFGLGLYDHPYNYETISWINDQSFDPSTNWANSANATRLFRRLMSDPDFKRAFTERAAIYMGDFVNVDRVWEIVEPMYAKIKSELVFHKEAVGKKNGGYGTWWPNYASELSKAKEWLTKRPDFFYKHMADYYKLGTPTKLVINQELTETDLSDIEVKMNGIKLTRGTFHGKFYQDSEVCLKGKHIGAWKIVVEDKSGHSEKTVEGSTCTFTMPSCTSVSVNAIEFNPIEEITSSEASTPAEYYDLSGIRHSQLQKGQNIIRMKDGSTKKIVVLP